ncbi:DUF488 domain-containing protein [Rhizobium tubonense]|uniref:DUF488 domain-containing protein n=1 Tax=Rhizobium tubonense TaxID=484088 RepID=UPI003B82FE60
MKRIYEQSAESDGIRVLVDRLWPRGLTKKDARIDVWMKEIAPSPGLRKWFAHRVDRWEEFAVRYTSELRLNPAVDNLRTLGSKSIVSLLYAAHDDEHNHAIVLKSVISSEE